MKKKRILAIAISLLSTTAQAATKDSRTAGEATYQASGCAQCHGPAWSGTDRGPDLRGVAKRLNRTQLTTQIHEGGGGMPPFADALTADQITHLVDFLEAQKKLPKQSKSQMKAAAHPVPVQTQKKADPEE